MALCHKGGKQKFVVDKLKPLMVAKYYSTSFTKSFYYPSVLMNRTQHYSWLNSLYNQIFIKMKIVGEGVSLLNGSNALVTPKQKSTYSENPESSKSQTTEVAKVY